MMRIRIAVCLVVLSVSLSGSAFAAPGILLLADDGKPEWKTHLMQLAATVDRQNPTEVAFWSSANPTVQAAVDRLVQRGVSEIVAVPLFIAAPASLSSRVKASVPLRITAPLNGDPVAVDIVLGRALEVTANAANEVIVLVSHRSTDGTDQRWVPDLAATAQQLNRMRRFAMIVTTALPPDQSEASAEDVAQLRRTLERQVALGRRILVVPVLTPYGGTEPAIEEQLQGLAHEVAKSALMPDDRLVAWIVSRAEGK
jgi:sirohydrochlorin ferrochelatase